MALGIRSPLEVIYFLAFVAIGLNFLISGILINVFQCLMWITIKPFNVWLYRKLNYFCTFAVWGQLQFLAEWWSSSTCLIYTDEKTWTQMGTEHAILLLNHSYEVDWVFSWFLCEQIGTLGCPRALVKKSFKVIPIIGWTAYFSENAFLERNFDADKRTIEKQVLNFSDNPDPVLFHVFAEGTRYTKAKHEASVDFAVKAGLTPLKHLLIPRTKGFIVCLDKLRGKFPAIYCATMVFDTERGASPVFKSLILGRPVKAEILLERIPLEDIPEDPDKASKWLHDNFAHKDNMIEAFKTQGMFPTALPGHHFEGPIRAHYRPRRIWTLLVILLTSCLTLPQVINVFHVLFVSGIFGATLSFLSIGLVIFVLLKLMDLSSASKGSEYGRSPRSKEN